MGNSNLFCFILGACAGATVAVLIAPQNGRRTRRMIEGKAQDTMESMADAGHDLCQRGKDLGIELVDHVAHIAR
jgi:gas vesicle protein